jgi:hypothetical protein
MRSTVTVVRGDVYLTVVVSHGTRSPDRVVEALDEDGDRVTLTPDERAAAVHLARDGADETGR